MLATYKLSIILNRTLLIDFMKYSQEFDEEELPLRTSKTQYDYYLEYENILPENMLIHKTLIALGNKGYEIVKADSISNSVLGKRGLRANEWKTVIGVYYDINREKQITQIYIFSKITQDFTGGWKDNRAKKVGIELDEILNEIEN